MTTNLLNILLNFHTLLTISSNSDETSLTTLIMLLINMEWLKL